MDKNTVGRATKFVRVRCVRNPRCSGKGMRGAEESAVSGRDDGPPEKEAASLQLAEQPQLSRLSLNELG